MCNFNKEVDTTTFKNEVKDTGDNNTPITYAITKGLRTGLDFRRIQMFGISAEDLDKLLPKKICTSESLISGRITIKNTPTRIVVRNGAINNFLDAFDRSCFDVAMFYEDIDTNFSQLNDDRVDYKKSLKQSISKSITKESNNAIEAGMTYEKNLANFKASFAKDDSNSLSDYSSIDNEELSEISLDDTVDELPSFSENTRPKIKNINTFSHGCTSYIATQNPTKG